MAITIRVLKVDQPIGEFYIGALNSKVLNSIADFDIREFKNDKAEDLAGIQEETLPYSFERDIALCQL